MLQDFCILAELLYPFKTLVRQVSPQNIFSDGLFYGLTPVHNQKAKLSTRSG